MNPALRGTIAALCIAFAAPPRVAAHEIQHQVDAAGAVSVQLTYPDGKPFAYESYELFLESGELPVQVGKTDAQGRVVFLPGGAEKWRLRTFSADGHGADFRFLAPSPAARAVENPGLERNSRILFGLSLLLAIFAVYQLFRQRWPKDE